MASKNDVYAGGLSVFQSSFSKQTARQELEESYDSLVVPFRTSLDMPESSHRKQPSPRPSSRISEAAEMHSARQSRENAASAALGQETSPAGYNDMSQSAEEQRVEVPFTGGGQILEVNEPWVQGADPEGLFQRMSL